MTKVSNNCCASLGAALQAAKPAPKQKINSSKLWAGCVMAAMAGHATSQPAPLPSAEQQERRTQERERLLREQQEKTPDVRILKDAPTEAARLVADESPCFTINALTLRGADNATPIPQFAWALEAAAGPDHNDAPTGRCLGAQSIGVVINRLQNAVMARGYVTTRILAEPQDLNSGVLALTVIPGRVHAIRFTPDSDARANAWTAVPAKPGDILNLRDIEQALENFKRLPTAEADIQIEPTAGPAAQPGQSDLVISYRQPFPFRFSASFDDSGAKATGKYQGGATLSYDNWLTLNDLFYVSLNHHLASGSQGEQGTQGNTAHYSVPLGYWLLGATAGNSRYRQSVAGASQTYIYSGSSSNSEVKLSRLVHRDAARKTTLAIRAFQRTSNNYINDTEVQVQRRKVGGFEASVNHREFIGAATLDMNLAYKRGTGAFGSLPAPEEAFGEGTSRMKITTADLAINAPFKAFEQPFRYTGVLRAQFNHTRLTPQDRFAIGGRYTVRGFDGESSLSAERGWLIRNELSVALGASGQQAYVGLDHGRVRGPSSELLVGKWLTGAVMGVRGGIKNLQYELFVGAPVYKPSGFRTANSVVGFSVNWSF